MTGEQAIHGLDSDHEAYLSELSAKIDAAYEYSQETTLLPLENGQFTIQGILSESEEYAQVIRDSLLNNSDMHLEGSEPGLNEVTVDEADKFEDLLRLAYTRVGFDKALIPTLVGHDLEHEFAHVEAIKDEQDIKIKYGVAFYRDTSQDKVGFRPAVIVSGNLSLTKAEQFFSGPKNHSVSDKIVSEAFRLPLHLKMRKIVKKLAKRN